MDGEKKEGEEDEGEHIVLSSPCDWRTVAESIHKTESSFKLRSAINISLIFFSSCTTDGWESASISDDGEDGEWVDVHHSSDEDTGEVVRMKLSTSHQIADG